MLISNCLDLPSEDTVECKDGVIGGVIDNAVNEDDSTDMGEAEDMDIDDE